MLRESLGTIEVLGLPAAIEAADVACKSANVTLIGYETTDGMGMVAVKISGQISAVQSAIQAATVAAGRISQVFATSVIARPSEQIEPVVYTALTVGLAKPSATPASAPVAEPTAVEPAAVEAAADEATTPAEAAATAPAPRSRSKKEPQRRNA